MFRLDRLVRISHQVGRADDTSRSSLLDYHRHSYIISTFFQPFHECLGTGHSTWLGLQLGIPTP